MDIINPSIDRFIKRQIHGMYANARLCELYLFKFVNIIKRNDHRVTNFFKLLIIPSELLPDVLPHITYIRLDSIIREDEYQFDVSPQLLLNVIKYRTRKDDQFTNYSRLYTCPKCGDNKTIIREKQCRALDEPLSLIIICINENCNYRWRIG